MESRVCTDCEKEKELNFYYTYKRKGKVLYNGKCKECSKKGEEKRKNSDFRKLREVEKLLNNRGYKTCKSCNEIKELSVFAKGRKMCKPCYREYHNKHNKDYKENNIDKVKAYNREYNSKKWRKDNAEEIVIRESVKNREKETGLRVCIICKEEKRFKMFPENGVGINGNQLYTKKCILCTGQSIQKWRKENYEERLSYRKKFYGENKERLIQRKKEYYQSEQGKTYRNKYNEENKEKRNKYLVRKRKEDPVSALAHNLRSRTAHAFSKRGYTKRSKTYDYLGISFEDLKEYISNLFEEGMSWDNREDWHIDHVIPLAAAESEDELIALCYYMNLDPLWANDNMSKSYSYDPEDKRKYLEWYSANVKKLDL